MSVNDRARPLVLLLVLVLIILAALQLPGVRLPFVEHTQAQPLPGMNHSQCVEAGGHFDIILGCTR
jgi:hypothetical protein